MQRIFPNALLILMTLVTINSASADDKEMIFRADSGLTKAEYLLAVGQYSAAIDTANQVLSRHPADADAYTYRGYALYRLGQNAEAAKNFKMALQLNPMHLGANKYLADTYLQSGDVSRALEQMQVIRMACGRADCEELNSLEREIDQYKSSGKPKEDKKDDKE